MDTKASIIRLRKLLEEEIYLHQRKHVHKEEIKQLIVAINNDLLTSYDKQREFISQILFVYEQSTDHSINILFPQFLNEIEDLKKLNIEPLDLSFWEEEFDLESAFEQFEPFLKQYVVYGQQVRLSNDLGVQIDVHNGARFLRLIHRLISHDSKKHTADADDITGIMLQLWMARNIARAINRKELFYLLISIFFDGLHYKENYQFARDLVEECLICSYKDEMPEYGYYLSFKVFSSTSSAVTALHYALIANVAFSRKGIITDYLLKNYYWEAIKFARDIKLIPYAISLFQKRPLNVEYSIYENNKLHHAYYSSLFYLKDRRLPGLILDYISGVKEEIIDTGEHEVLPWFSLLLSVKKNYSVDQYDAELVDQYIELFKRIVTPENYSRIYTALFGSVYQTITALKKSLLSLTFTRNPSDFVTDNKAAIQISHSNILESFRQENVEGYLLSMILQSDFSIVFKDKETQLILPVHESYKIKDFEKEYYTPEFLKDFILKQKGVDILWLGTDNHKILPLYHSLDNFTFLKDKERSLYEASVYAKEIIKKLPLQTRTQRGDEKFFEDYAQEEVSLKKEINFFELPIKPIQTLLLIKDIELSSFPHNLMTTQDDFVSNMVPISNIMSIEWLVENNQSSLPAVPSKSIWIPVESGDWPVSMMHGKMEDDLVRFNITQYQKILPEVPLDCDINVLVAHGSSSISTFPAFYLENNTDTFSIRNFDHIVGKGKILILFVCHSGSERSDLFRNQTLTVVKQFLQNGYQAVIAPFWALHIEIPPIWLPEFLEQLHIGKDVGTAVFHANKKVRTVFNTPKAYACLHLYGNPFLKIANP
jgi:hypothetical protein